MQRQWTPIKEYSDILFEYFEGIAKITINRPQVLRRPAQLSDAYPGISFFLLNLLKLSMACSVRNACFLSIDTSGQKEALERINASLRDLCRR